MSNTIQLGAIETNLEDIGTDNHGMGSDYYRRKPYVVESRSFDDNVKKQFPHRDADMEDYLVDRAQTHQLDRVDNPSKIRGANFLPKPHWDRRHDKVRHNIYEQGAAEDRGLTQRNSPTGPYNAAATYNSTRDSEPTIDTYTGGESNAVHEGMHYLADPNPGSPDYTYSDPRKAIPIPDLKRLKTWGTRGGEIMAEAAEAKRRYAHQTVSNRKSQLGYYDYDEDPNYYDYDKEEYQDAIRSNYKDYHGSEPFDENHPAVKEGKPIPNEVIDDMFQQWMFEDRKGWGDAHRSRPEEFPVEVFKEALRLGKNDQRPAGMFTGRGPQNA